MEIATLMRRAAIAYKDEKYDVWTCTTDHEWIASRTQLMWPAPEAHCH